VHIVITGANGFIGSRLARALLSISRLPDGRAIERMVLSDQAPCALSDPRASSVAGDIGDPALARQLIQPGTDIVFHLAGVMSGASESDFGLGMHVNLEGTRNVLEACRALPRPARVVYASSIAVYGAPLPAVVDDDTPTRPTLSYGAQKLACEVLLDDYSRRGFVDGRALRLPGIVARARAPSGALSAFNSDLIREPLQGRPISLPVGPDAVMWVQSIDRCTQNLVHAAMLFPNALGARRTLILPCVVASAAEIVAAIGRVAGAQAAALVRYAPEPAIEAQFGRLPRMLRAGRALALGFRADAGIDEVIQLHRGGASAPADAA
jgi:nucleoside-diphosphate-sugar epimerase